MPSASLKRGRLTARLGRLDTLPGGPETLKKQISEKEETLAKLCSQYEGLVKASEEKKKNVENVKKRLQQAQSRAGEMEQNRKKLENLSQTPKISPTPTRRRREGIEAENGDLQDRIAKGRKRLKTLQQKHEREQSESKRRKDQMTRWQNEEKDILEAAERDEKEAQELESFISRLSESLFKRQREYEEILIADPIEWNNGIKRKLREERRRLLKERQILERDWSKEEDFEEDEDGQIRSPESEKDVEKIADQWIKVMDEQLFSDVKLSEQEGIGHGLSTRINQIEAAIRLLRMKKEPTMYTAYTQREEIRTKKDQLFDSGVRVPDFKRKIKEFIQREQAMNRAFLGDSNQDVDGSYWEHLEDVQKENTRRKQMVQQGEEWAREKLAEELTAKMKVVEKAQHETETAENYGNKLKKELQTKKQEIRNEEKKKEAAERRRRQRKVDLEQSKRKAENLRRQKVEERQTRVLELRSKRTEAETKRRQLRTEITVAERETSDTKATLHALRMRSQNDMPELQKQVEIWRGRVQELQSMEEDLRKMLAEATRSNQEAKEQLSVVKPYQVEQQEMDYLMEQERQLDRQLKETQRQHDAEISFSDSFR